MRALVTVSSDSKVNGCDGQTLGMHGKADPLCVRGKGLSVSSAGAWGSRSSSVKAGGTISAGGGAALGKCDIVVLACRWSAFPFLCSGSWGWRHLSAATLDCQVACLGRTLEASQSSVSVTHLPEQCTGLLSSWLCPPLKCAFSEVIDAFDFWLCLTLVINSMLSFVSC